MAPEPDPHDFATLAAQLHAAPTVTQTADQVVEYARQQMDADHAGLTILERDGRLRTIAPSSALVEKLDHLQRELQDGSSVDAAWEGETVRAPDLAADPRWPRWAPRAAGLGVVSALSVALPDVEGRRIGALNMYWGRRRDFSPDDVAFAHILGRHAAVALSVTFKETNLRIALDTRKLIGQAQGILMERFDLTADQAFQVLRRYSQDRNQKLRHVAEGLVATRRLPPTADPS